MKFYFAASLAEKDIAKELSEKIENRTNWKCTSTWFMPSKRNGVDTAIDCLEEVDSADVLILYASTKTRGKWLECGYALAKNKPIIFYIENSNISHPTFAYMPQFTWVYNIKELVDQILKDRENA